MKSSNKLFLHYTQHNHSPPWPCIIKKTNKLCKKMHHHRKILSVLDPPLPLPLPLALNQIKRRSLIFKIPGDGDGELDIEPGPGATSELSTPHSVFQQINSTTQTPLKSTTSTRNNNFNYEQRHQPTSAFDSSLALTILVLLTALFFMGFFSLYLRRLAHDQTSTASPRRSSDSVPPISSVYHHDQKGKGLDPSTVRSLPTVCYSEDVKQITFSDCPICLAEFEQPDIVKIIPYCRHVFHTECIDTWLSSHVSCPFCRSTKFYKEERDGDDDDDDGGVDDIRLDVKREQDNNGVGESSYRSTVEDEDTSREVGMRRNRSWTRLGDRVLLQRSMSF